MFQRLSKSFVFQRLQCLLPLLFKDYHSLLSCRDNQGHLLLYFLKTIRVFCLAETIHVIHLYFPKTIIVCCLVETIKFICFFTFFKDYLSLLSRLSQSSFLFKDYQSLLSCRDNQGHILLYFSKTVIVCCLTDAILPPKNSAAIYLPRSKGIH